MLSSGRGGGARGKSQRRRLLAERRSCALLARAAVARPLVVLRALVARAVVLREPRIFFAMRHLDARWAPRLLRSIDAVFLAALTLIVFSGFAVVYEFV